jgi:hypothetical protein
VLIRALSVFERVHDQNHDGNAQDDQHTNPGDSSRELRLPQLVEPDDDGSEDTGSHYRSSEQGE